MSTACVICGSPTLVRGWDWCEQCATDQGNEKLGLAHIADAIVQLDQRGVPRGDRVTLWLRFGVTKDRLEAAEEVVTQRYIAGKVKRGRSSRGW
jgi:hypothetical protein